ncbi:MAG: S8 family peptidase, partial [Halioglobus sp.]|nr:S8 family peptidase [Halioglobus sp.]
WEHPALARNTRGEPRVLARYDATSGTLQEQVADGSGHGTHMSSIIAHSGPTLSGGQPTGTYKGVAPDANLVAVKVLDREGRAHILDIAQAVQWVVDNRQQYNIRILNISLAQRPRWPYWEDPVTQVVMRAWAAGITVLAAASNEGPEPMSIGSPGNLPYIITVGAVTDSWTPDTRDDDYIPDFSSRGPTPSGHVKPDIVALGGHMTGLTPPDAQMAEQDPENMLSTGELISTGSSQSAALVSGIAALLLQLEPGLTPDDIKCKLTTSAEPAINADGTLAYSPFAQGYGYVTAPRAVTLGRTDCESSAAQLQADLQGVERVFGPAVFHDDDATARLPAVQGQISTLPSAKGMSDTRKWGVKDHIERLDKAAIDRYRKSDLPLNWLQLYLEEKTAIEKLGDPAAP